MWHLENPDEPGVRIGGYFFSKESAEKARNRIAQGMRTTAASRVKNFKLLNLIAVEDA